MAQAASVSNPFTLKDPNFSLGGGGGAVVVVGVFLFWSFCLKARVTFCLCF